MTISPREVSSKTLMISQALAVKFRVLAVLTMRRDHSCGFRDHVEVGECRINLLRQQWT
jgi:hypothetical protein